MLVLGCSCGPGSNDGCLNEIPLDTDGSAAANRSKPIIRTADKLKNIYATTPKKGGFGMPWKDRTLGAPPVYYMDGYEGGRQKEKVRDSCDRNCMPCPVDWINVVAHDQALYRDQPTLQC